MAFRPNTTCDIYRKAGDDIYGSIQYETKPRKTPCAVVTYDLATAKSSVRADTSGTRGRSDALEGVARFLFPRMVEIQTGDRVEKDGFTLEVIEVHPRRTVQGGLDHLEVDMRKAVRDEN